MLCESGFYWFPLILYVKLVVDLRGTMSEAIEKMSKDIDTLKNRLEEFESVAELRKSIEQGY